MNTVPSNQALRRRTGSIYVLILFVSAIVTAIGLSAASLTRLAQKGEARMADVISAQTVAIAGVEHAHHEVTLAIESSPATWRTTIGTAPHGPFNVGDGSFTWLVKDADGNFFDDPLDPVIIEVDADYESAHHRVNFTLAPGPGVQGVSCLSSAVHAGGDSTYDGNYFSSDGILSTNGDMSVDSDIHADVRAVGSTSGSTYHETAVSGAAALEMPSASALDYYLAHGTYIDISPLEHVGSADGHFDFQDLVLTPYLNPFGPANPEGIYILDCEGNHLKIKNSRIIGTLVVINANPASPTKIEKSLSWEPAFPNYPALLVEGDLIFKLEDPPLSESGRFTNFNPIGAPFQGNENTTQLDDFPNVSKGLFYATGSITIQADGTAGPQYIEGVIVAGGDVIGLTGTEFHVRYDDTWALDPPPGFAQPLGPHELVPGSFVRVMD